jgi:hypothetical protein
MATEALTRILVVADWTVEPAEIVAECRRRAQREPALFILMVPAWLHGLDWAGDPHAAEPCAQRQLATLARLCVDAGLDVEVAGVGDPSPISAIGDALAGWAATGVLLCTRPRHVPSHPFDLLHRAHRMTGLPVQRVVIGPAPGGGHCVADQPLAA